MYRERERKPIEHMTRAELEDELFQWRQQENTLLRTVQRLREGGLRLTNLEGLMTARLYEARGRIVGWERLTCFPGKESTNNSVKARMVGIRKALGAGTIVSHYYLSYSLSPAGIERIRTILGE